MSTEDKLIWCYLIYIIVMFVWLAFLYAGAAYVVFWLDRTAWWFALPVFLSFCQISTKSWRGLLTGIGDEDA